MLQIIRKIFTKKNFLIALLIVWIGFSIFYIIRDQWQKFTESKTEQEAQNEVKNLLEVLVKSISY